MTIIEVKFSVQHSLNVYNIKMIMKIFHLKKMTGYSNCGILKIPQGDNNYSELQLAHNIIYKSQTS